MIGRRRVRGVRGEERGAILVESALILPLLLLVVFGIIEFSMAYWSTSMIDEGTRQGGRAASHLGTVSDYEQQIANATREDVAAMPGTATPVFLAVYKANTDGYPGNPGNKNWIVGFQQCTQPSVQSCTLMAWNPSAKDWQPAGAAPILGIGNSRWEHTSHQVCPQMGEVDRIGVAVAMDYAPMIGMFDSVLKRDGLDLIVRASVLSFEPGPSAICGGA